MIAGAGIGGMLLANGLAKAGAEVHLYEKSDRLRVSGGPILIQSNALASIEAINRTIAREAMRVGTINACRVNGTRKPKPQPKHPRPPTPRVFFCLNGRTDAATSTLGGRACAFKC
jgi:2-polyprenyl-6-methoxyphenol hydroxylase-like FAD-dependent oxidoreductase